MPCDAIAQRGGGREDTGKRRERRNEVVTEGGSCVMPGR